MTSTLGVAVNGKENHRLFTPKGIDEFEVRTPPFLSSYHTSPQQQRSVLCLCAARSLGL